MPPIPIEQASPFGQPPDESFLPSRRVRARYGVTDMSLWRWWHDPAKGFPAPVYIGRYRYWRLSDLQAFEQRLNNGAAA